MPALTFSGNTNGAKTQDRALVLANTAANAMVGIHIRPLQANVNPNSHARFRGCLPGDRFGQPQGVGSGLYDSSKSAFGFALHAAVIIAGSP